MASEPVSLEFLGEQLKRVQADIRDLKSRVLLVENDQSEMRRDLERDFTRLEGKVDALAERTDDRFDRMDQVLQQLLRTLSGQFADLKQDIESLRKR